MSDEAGSVTIQITGNVAPFEAALAKAEQRAVAFDARISAQLNGTGVSEGLAKIAAGVEQTNAFLAKLTTTGTAASTVLSKVAASTRETTAALGGVATAAKLVNAEMGTLGAGSNAGLAAGTISAREFAAALEATGGNLSKITPRMLGLAEAETAVTAAALEAQAAFRGLTEAQIQSFSAQQEGANFNRALNESFGLINSTTKSAKDSALAFRELGLAEAEVGAQAKVAATEAAGLGAGVSREFSVLGSEVLRGNFSRIPGSLLVMNERLAGTGASVLTLGNGMKALGALGNVIFNPFVLGFLAISIGSEVAIRAFSGIKGSVLDVNTVLENNKKLIDDIAKAYPEAAVAAKQYEEQANQIPKSIAAADLKNQIADARKTLSADLDALRIDMHALGGEFALTGEAGSKAFEALSGRVHDGTISAQALYSEIGRLELDPKLSDEAHSFARSLEDAAKKAADLEKSISADSGINNIVQNDAKAQHTLFEISAGFKDVSANAGSADATIAKLFGTINTGGGSGFGVTKSLAGQFGSQLTGQLQTTLGMFEQVNAAVQNSRQNQLAGMVDLEAQFRATTTQVDVLKQAIATAGGKDNIQAFFGDVANIKDANAEISNATTTVQKLFDAMATGNASVSAVYHGLDMVRQTLTNDGFPVDKVNAFIDSLVRTNRELVADQGAAHQLNAAIQAIQNRTVTITVVTQQIGTGTKSIYDVGTTGGIGVTRYGGQSDMTQQSYQVPATGGSDTSIGTSGVTVTRFGGARAAGGPMSSGVPYLIGEHGPELVVPSGAGTVIPNAQTMALANPQSGFTGRDAVKENDRFWVALMNIEGNTRKTAQLLEEIKASSSSFASSSGSSGVGGSSSASSSPADQLAAQYMKVLAVWKSNFAAAGIVGSGNIGYGSQGLGATPEQIARNIVYGGGGTSVGSVGANDYENTLAQTQESMAQSEARRHKAIYGFDPGGMIAPGDTQKVEFFKNPNERVIIARPDQYTDARSQPAAPAASGDQRPIVNLYQTVKSDGAPPSRDSLASMQAAAALGVNAALRAYRGR